ncbi:c-type cytochrome [Piscinibacter gummiphilus]|uniref:C-type cytochrome n=1 Tax=Piscinibacter gummiphilus TaxID=946333 RepID=A0ABZ0D590_9BURK|nr:c-type cytochrome [Piscinibacter gummiphilus]WOB10213.1 c-type cytochrome [Piscinibacter gummiphilus]
MTEASADQGSVERGRFLVHGPAHCATCHAGTADGPAASAPLSGGRTFDLGLLGSFVAANLTGDASTGLGAWTDAELYRVLRTGRNRQGRPLAPLMDTTGMSDQDLLSIVAYLRSVPRVRHETGASEIGLMGRVALHWVIGTPVHAPPSASDASTDHAALGAYLANRVANCRGCHTPRSALTGRLTGPPFSGGLRLEEGGATFSVPDITGTGALRQRSEQSFIALFRARAQIPGASPMPWDAFSLMSDDELSAIYRYLKSLPGKGSSASTMRSQSVRSNRAGLCIRAPAPSAPSNESEYSGCHRR